MSLLIALWERTPILRWTAITLLGALVVFLIGE